jgi:hypothetical protein
MKRGCLKKQPLHFYHKFSVYQVDQVHLEGNAYGNSRPETKRAK